MKEAPGRETCARSSRRTLLKLAGTGVLAGTTLGRSLMALADDDLSELPLGPPEPFSFHQLVERARAMAQVAYVPPPRPAPEVVGRINYDVHGKIRFKPDLALGARSRFASPATFFHLGMYSTKTVKMHAVQDGKARLIHYRSDLFDMPQDSVARQLPADSGFAGFRLQESTARSDWRTQDWLAFLGASYFRAIGDQGQYGLSARGIAVHTSSPGRSEEFPDFIEYYIEPARAASEPTLVYGLLDGPSLSGAYRFRCQRGSGVVMDVDCKLFLRADVEQLGIAPLTSMFWYAEYDKPFRADWRPEIHDSDGLALWTGRGERIFRPLNAPKRVVTSSFLDRSPRGFGLVQRDRCFDHYLDGVRYDRRPSLWVEPLSDFGAGKVQLVEIPTEDEYHDNIVAFWAPEGSVKAGTALEYRYRLHWQAEPPHGDGNLARTVATRQGRIAEDSDDKRVTTRFVVEFAGGVLPRLAKGTQVRARIESSLGTLDKPMVEPRTGHGGLRVQFDLTAPHGVTAELKVVLEQDGQALSEVWTHQYETS